MTASTSSGIDSIKFSTSWPEISFQFLWRASSSSTIDFSSNSCNRLLTVTHVATGSSFRCKAVLSSRREAAGMTLVLVAGPLFRSIYGEHPSDSFRGSWRWRCSFWSSSIRILTKLWRFQIWTRRKNSKFVESHSLNPFFVWDAFFANFALFLLKHRKYTI